METIEKNKVKLGKRQLEIVELLKTDNERFIHHIQDYSTGKQIFTLSDKDGNDLLSLRLALFQSLINKGLLGCIKSINPSMDIYHSFYKLKPGVHPLSQ